MVIIGAGAFFCLSDQFEDSSHFRTVTNATQIFVVFLFCFVLLTINHYH